MFLESLRAAVAFLARAWSRPWFVATWAATVLAGLAAVTLTDPSRWTFLVTVLGAVFFLPLLQAPLYALSLDDISLPGSDRGGVSRYVRVVVTGLLTDLFLVVPALLIFVVGLGSAYGMAYSHPGFDRMDVSTWTASGPVLIGSLVVLGLGGLAMLWLSARVALGAAATVVEGRVLMISTWPLTRGKGWLLAAARLAVSMAVLVLIAVASAGARALAPGVAERAAYLIGGALLLGLRLPLKVGVMSYFYRRRSPLPTP